MTTNVPYRPSNGTEGAYFMARFCERCQRDDAFQKGVGDSCPIAASTMAFGIDHPDYPKEWIADDDLGHNARCTAFEPFKVSNDD